MHRGRSAPAVPIPLPDPGKAGFNDAYTTLWGLTASAARTWFARSDRRLAMIGGAGGCTMIGLGVSVALTGRAD